MRGAWRGFLRTRWGCCSTLAYKVARLSVVHIHRGHLKSIQLTPRNWRPNWAGQKVQVQAKQEKPSECLHFVRPQHTSGGKVKGNVSVNGDEGHRGESGWEKCVRMMMKGALGDMNGNSGQECARGNNECKCTRENIE
eukprot:1161032-Pelagomonas_calceolata.AAC.2